MTQIELDAARASLRIPRLMEKLVDNVGRIARPSGIDWEERRYELAKAAMEGIANIDYEPKIVAKAAVRFADAVIEELQKER